MPLLDMKDILSAADRIADVAVATPLINNPQLDELLGGKVYLKAECLQRKGAFKFRGAYNCLSRLDVAQRAGGVVACSSGNHAQGVAEAARLLGMPAVIVMPADSPKVKVEGTRSAGAEVVFYDRLTEDREAIAKGLCEERGAAFIHPFNNKLIMAGQATAGLEAARKILEQGDRLDLALLQVSGGGLAAGISTAVHDAFPACEIWACEPEGYDDVRYSLAAGEPIEVPELAQHGRGLLCDALLAPKPGDLTFPLLQAHIKECLAISDEAVLEAVAYAHKHLHLVVEPGGAIGLAALLNGAVKLEGRTCLVVLSGGNIDPPVLIQALER